MCTINSLERIWQYSHVKSLCSVLICFFLFVNQGRTGARFDHMAIQVQAPSDITINIKGISRCDTMLAIKPAIFSGHCSNNLTYTTYTSYGSRATNGGLFYFPTGVHKVYFIIADDCRMSGIDSMMVTVFDAQLPQVVCAPAQTINLATHGFGDIPAYLFDGGSSDNCDHLYFKIKRMFPPLNYSCHSPSNPDNRFDDAVRFCCQDVDSSGIMVILRVYDIFPGEGPVHDSTLIGHYVDCMVETIVRDKLVPEISCPPDITIYCGQDLDSTLLVGQVYYSDNCGILRIDSFEHDMLDACGSGMYSRTFIATDNHGLQNSCVQTITVNRTHSFNGLDPKQLKWPDHKVVYACRIDLDTIQSGVPQIFDDKCALVQTKKRDEIYYFNHGGVCAKVLRYWEVIDWCQYNPALKPNPKTPSNGYYSYVQEIKVFDTTAPVIIGVRDTMIGIQTPDCGPGLVLLPDISASDCSSTDNIAYRYEIDLFSNKNIDSSRIGNNASGYYPIGKHLIHYFAKDSCHNESESIMELHIVDAKPPSALAIFGLSASLSLMPNGPMVSMNAKLFNNKSVDNCSLPQHLRFSFSTNINDTIRIFNCDSMGRRDICLVVWDEAGNYNMVKTFVVINDVDLVCPTSIRTVTINGLTMTSSKQEVDQAVVELISPGYSSSTISGNGGKFLFADIPSSSVMQLRGNSSYQFEQGITTADIIKIQRHILGIQTFDNPHQYIAADVDMNGSITTRDVVHIRNLILGNTSSYPSGKSYVFINSDYKFKQPLNPYGELEECQKIMLHSPAGIVDAEFTAIKLGDLNLSFNYSGFSHIYNNKVHLNYQIKGNSLKIFPPSNDLISGFQMEIIFDNICLNEVQEIISSLKNWSNLNYTIHDKKVRISYSQSEQNKLNTNTAFLELVFKNKLSSCQLNPELNSTFNQEWIANDQIFSIENLRPNENILSEYINQIKISPNPFEEITKLELYVDLECDIRIEVYSLDQKIIYNRRIKLQPGWNELELSSSQLGRAGVYFLHAYNDSYSSVQKLIIK